VTRFTCLVLATVLCVPGRARAQELQRPPDAKELDTLWSDLADEDAAKAYRAICRLALNPSPAVSLLRTRLRRAPPLDEKEVSRLVGLLDNETFDEREKAQRELEQLGEPIRAHLTTALSRSPGPEARRRLEAVLQRLDEEVLTPETLRAVRAVEALERMGTAEARRLVKELAAGAPGARLTREAQASLSRMTPKR
jgi:hypothetical protein